MATLGLHLKRFVESHGRDAAVKTFKEAVETRKIRKEEISIRELAENMIGPRWDRHLQNRLKLREAWEAVDASGFADITGQLLIQNVHEQYKAAEFIFPGLIDSEQITNGNLGPQREPWLSYLTSGPQQVQQGMDYPQASFSPNFVDYPAPQKWGEICRVTFEMIFSDLTKQVFDSAGSAGLRLAIWKEEMIANTIFGLTSTIGNQVVNGNSHSWNGTTFSTYQTAAPWVNTISGLQVTDWSHLNLIEQLYVNLLDPNTGKPIQIRPNAAIVSPFKYNYWKRIMNATNTRQGAYPTSGATNTLTDAPSPLDNEYPTYKSPYAYQLLLSSGLSATQAQEYVVVGDFKKAFVWRYVWPMQVAEAPPGNPAEFNQDITFSLKASEFGVACVKDPRYTALAYNT